MAIVVGPTSWQFSSRLILGDSVAGGFLICKSGGVAWIVAPAATEVSRDWYCRDDAVTTAQASASCGDWFVPTCGQLQNPGYACRAYWDSYSSPAYYKSSTEYSGNTAWAVLFPGGNTRSDRGKVSVDCIRAFRCVTY